MFGAHEKLDSLTAIATTSDNNFLVTGDTAGSMKLWDITDFKFRIEHNSDNIIELWFIQVHKRVINGLEVVELVSGEDDKPRKFIVSCSNDHNIHLTRFDGVHIGQFGQDSMWNIHDLTAFDKRKPNYTRSWLLKVIA